LTGATGFLGKVVLHELLRRREEFGIERIHLLIRGKRSSTPQDRFRQVVLSSPCFSRLAADWPSYVEVVAGELTKLGAGLSDEDRQQLTSRITHVVHCAASIEFDLPIPKAAASNIASALHVLELARECPKLVSMVDVSTAYVTPHPGDHVEIEEKLAPLPRPAGEIYEAILEGAYDPPEAQSRLLEETGHPNTYTLTKCIAEHLLHERAGVPLSVVRPSIISASLRQPFADWIDSPAAFAVFIIMVALGRMRALVGRPRARIDLIPVDAVADRVIEAAFNPPAADEPPRILHAVCGYERSPQVSVCASRVSRFFTHNPVGEGRGPVAALRYVGPDGVLYRIHHFLQHRLRKHSRPLANRMDETNKVFAYFTHNTFRFKSSCPGDDLEPDVERYLDLICRGIYRHLLGGDKTEVALAGRGHKRAFADFWWALLQPKGNFFIRISAYAVAKALRRATDRVTVDIKSFRDALDQVPDGSIKVLVPSHRSYLDFVLASFLCFARPDLGIPIPHVAAAVEFARIPLLGWLFGKLHAFYLERGVGREDKNLTLRIDQLVREQCSLEFFMEGKRSRSRRFLAPRRGVLRSLQSTGAPCALLPVAISYDHVPEESTFVAELGGAPTPPMRLRDLLGWIWRLTRGRVELGRIHIACSAPRLLDLSTDIHAVSRGIIADLQADTVCTTHQLRSFLDRARPAGVELEDLRKAIVARGGRVLEVPTLEREVPEVVERCMRNHFVHLFYPEAAALYADNPAIIHHLRRNDWMLRGAAIPSDYDDDTTRAVVQELFDAIRRDYATVARALERFTNAPGQTLPSAADVAREHPDTHLPDLEAAYDDLCERGVLTRRDDSGFAWGPRAAELGRYRARCESEPATGTL
jgi:thioester reductase-like protein